MSHTRSTSTTTALRDRIDREFAAVLEVLRGLVRIPSVSADGFDPALVRRSAEAVRDLFLAEGLPRVAMLEIEGAHPAVFAERPGPPAAPTVLLYAHHDVQPPGDLDAWTTPPFEPAARDGRLYGRGASDDKAGIAVHLAALRALGPDPALTIKCFIEGEEEIGSAHLPTYLAQFADRLRADLIVIADTANWRVGQPAITTSLRGLVDCTVEVRTLDHGVHSGLFGGAVPDALSALARLLATLHDDLGRPAVRGLAADDAPPLDLSEDELRAQAGMRPGVDLLGTGTLTSRLWTRPAISVLGIDAPPVEGAINQLVPRARARISVRLAPGDDPARAFRALRAHLLAHAPWGAELTVTEGARAAPFVLRTGGPGDRAFRRACREAWGVDPVEIGVGGSIPFVAAFAAIFPEAELLLTAVGDPTSAIHGPNESQDLDDLRKACLAEALTLHALGSGAS